LEIGCSGMFKFIMHLDQCFSHIFIYFSVNTLKLTVGAEKDETMLNGHEVARNNGILVATYQNKRQYSWLD
jgi:hypothetical protein